MISDDDANAGTLGGAVEQGDHLRTALASRTREVKLLVALSAGLGSPQTLDEALSAVTRSLLDSGICRRARIYLYDSKAGCLVLRSIDASALPVGSRETVALGEGLMGRVALTLQPVLRERQGAESQEGWLWGEEDLPALLVSPLLTGSHSLLGVVVLQSEQAAHLAHAFIGQVMALAAAVIERAQINETMQRGLGAALAPFRQVMNTGWSRDALLDRLVSFTGQVMDAACCVVLLFDRTRGTLVLRAASPALPGGGSAPTLSLNPQMLDMLTELSVTGQFSELSGYVRPRLDPLAHLGYRGLIAIPLLGEKGLRGLLYCYYPGERFPRVEELPFLPLLAMQACAELGRYDLLDLLNQRYLLKSFFGRLLSHAGGSEETLHSHAAMLGLNLLHPFCLVLVEVGVEVQEESDLDGLPGEGGDSHPIVERIAKQLSGLLQQDYPGSLLFEQGAILTCLIDVCEDPSGLRLGDWLIECYLSLSAESGVRLCFGLSTPCQAVGDFRRGFTEAGQALQLGPKISPDGGVIHWRDIRIFSYLTNFTTPQGLRDRFQEVIETLARHDRTHLPRKDHLLETLEAFLEAYGIVTKAAQRLDVHRNTVEQRLGRIKEVAGIDLESEEVSGSLLDFLATLRVYRRGAPRVD